MKKPVARKPTATKATADKPASRKMGQLDAAVNVLHDAKEPINCRAMVEAMAKKKLWTSPASKMPDATFYAAILREIVAQASMLARAPGYAGTTFLT